ncbi:CLUMA_CG004785, isoform A [Clunio marinus]|uniref:CLUMA_CG004785, isoform A n=1 Tax=Clunio marinus TaxID=568069 RepID=A0A1J1HY80_9DIPT|nr:CLUMA_CG004785, isoform A [Clunio marinus]
MYHHYTHLNDEEFRDLAPRLYRPENKSGTLIKNASKVEAKAKALICNIIVLKDLPLESLTTSHLHTLPIVSSLFLIMKIIKQTRLRTDFNIIMLNNVMLIRDGNLCLSSQK